MGENMNMENQRKANQFIGILTTALVLFALAGFSSVAANEDEEAVSVTFDKSLMNSQAGIEQVYKKLKISTKRACQRPNTVLNSLEARLTCNKNVLAQFLAKVDDLRLTHYAKTGQHLNESQLASN